MSTDFRFSFSSTPLNISIDTGDGNYYPLNSETLFFFNSNDSAITVNDLMENYSIKNTYSDLIPSLKKLGAVIDSFQVNVTAHGRVAFYSNYIFAINFPSLPRINYYFRVNLIDKHFFDLEDFSIDSGNPDCYNIIYVVPTLISKNSYLYIRDINISRTVDITGFYEDVFNAQISFISFNIILNTKNDFNIATGNNPFILGNLEFFPKAPTAVCFTGNHHSGEFIYTNVNVSATFTFQGHFTCSPSNIFSPLCKIVIPCNENAGTAKACESFFEYFKQACQQNLSSDDCYQFIQGYYKYVTQGKSDSQIDDYIKSYCSSKGYSMFNDPNGSIRDTELCGCHLRDNFYDEFTKGVEDYVKQEGYNIDISNAFSGIKKRCLFPACGTSPFPSLGTDCSNVSVCVNDLQIDDNTGKIKKITISQSCIQNLQSLRRKPIFASPPSGASSSKASNYAYLILATIVIALLILMLPFLLRNIRSMRKLRK